MSKKNPNRMVIHMKSGQQYVKMAYSFTLGVDYRIKTVYKYYSPSVMGLTCRRLICRFVKVTPKGFNLLNLETSKCILRSHLYCQKWVGKDVPPKETKFRMWVPEWIEVLGVLSKEDTG